MRFCGRSVSPSAPAVVTMCSGGRALEELLNLQQDGGKAKPYQVRQVRNVVLKYNLGTGS